MTTAKRSQYQVTVSSASDRRDAGPRGAGWLVVGAFALTLVTVVSAMTGPGARLDRGVFRFLEFYCGVFCLVSLSVAIMAGFAAGDRVVLGVRHRIIMQGVHRALATMAMVFLGIHIATKIVEGHASVVDVVVPFVNGHRPVFVGLGTLACSLMVGVMVTGVVRGRFAGTRGVWLWRVLHASAYLCWPVALVHGLGAGRPAKPWVTVSYLLCVVAVGIALVVRAYGRRTLAPVSAAPAVPREPPAARQPASSREATVARELAPAGRPRGRQAPPPERQPQPGPRPGSQPSPQSPPQSPPRSGPRAQTPPQSRSQRGSERPGPGSRSMSDDEFWTFMRGGTPR